MFYSTSTNIFKIQKLGDSVFCKRIDRISEHSPSISLNHCRCGVWPQAEPSHLRCERRSSIDDLISNPLVSELFISLFLCVLCGLEELNHSDATVNKIKSQIPGGLTPSRVLKRSIGIKQSTHQTKSRTNHQKSLERTATAKSS